jgi:hypothetical protein
VDPIEVHPGERRYVAAELAALLAEGDSLTGTPTVTAVRKRGRIPADYIDDSPAPAVDETSVEFWLEIPEYDPETDDESPRGIYLAIVRCDTAAGETIEEEVPIIVL